ncbi:MAG: deoxyribonuclease V [Chloroflexota bacterium]
MKIQQIHSWRLPVPEAQQLQRQLAPRVSMRNEVQQVRLVAGVDIAAGRSGGTARGVVVVVQYPEMVLVEQRTVDQKLEFPYVPGLLSFRELPLIIAAWEKLSVWPDLVLVDGHGLAHPRRLGIACHLGLLLDTPAIGCAKTILCGSHDELGREAGCHASLVDRGEIVGAALRTRQGVKPVYVSIGHKVDLGAAMDWVSRCCRGFRLPEPTRMAHAVAGGASLELVKERS